MIQISGSAFEQKTLANKHYNILKKVFNIEEKIDKVLADKKIPLYERKLFNILKNNLKKIITSSPDELKKINLIIYPLYQVYLSKRTHGCKRKDRKTIVGIANNKIFSIFDYTSFIKKNDGRYAYNFTENLNVSVCVYCNRQYTSTLWTEDGKCRPALDHFFAKATYPYFALSFFNLIPSCYTCNSSLKNQKEFTLGSNLHPFRESMFDVLNFSVDISSVDFIDGSKKNFKIILKQSQLCSDKMLISKAEANAEIFKINELYNGHKDYASEIIKKSYYYDCSKIDELFNFQTSNGNKLFESREEVIEFTLGNYIRKDKLGIRPLSKFARDIAYDLGIHKLI